MSVIRLVAASGECQYRPAEDCFLYHPTPDTTFLFTSSGLVLIQKDRTSTTENKAATALVCSSDGPICGDVELFCFNTKDIPSSESKEKINSKPRIASIGTRTYRDFLVYYGLQSLRRGTPILSFLWHDLGQDRYAVCLPRGRDDCRIIRSVVHSPEIILSSAIAPTIANGNVPGVAVMMPPSVPN
jgi:hypothetical protein